MHIRTALLVGVSLLAVAPAHAQTQIPAPPSAGTQASGDSQSPEEIVVVGSSIRVKEAEIQRGPTPIQVISAETIKAAGQSTLGDLLRTEPVFGGTSASADGVGLGRVTLDLRGVGDQYTLSLIDGHRFAVNGAANVGIIPLSAIERVEVLTSGASSIYGSDAVAGVVNIVLKKDADGAGAEFRDGAGSADYAEREYSAYIGSRGEDGGFILTFDRFERDGLLGADLPDGTNNLSRFGFLDLRSTATNPGNITLPNGNDVILNTSKFGPGTYSLNPADYRTFNANRDGYDRFQGGIYAISPTDRTSVALSGHREFGEQDSLKFDIIVNRTHDMYITGAPVGVATVPATNPYNPFGTPVSATYRFDDYSSGPFNQGEGQINQYTIDTVSAALTYEHSFTDDLKGSVTADYFHEDSRLSLPNAYSQQGFEDALNRSGSSAFNPFCNRCDTAAQYSGVLVGANSESISQLVDIDARITGTLFTLPAGDLHFAFGGGYREEQYDVSADPLYAQGGLIDEGTITPQNLSRGVGDVFAEFRAPVIQNVDMQVAFRYEDYSDFGGTFNPLVAGKWQVIPDNLTFRASYSTSFNAPFLQDLTSERLSSETVVVDPATNKTVNAVAVTGGNKNLKPETGETYSVGIIATPEVVSGFTASIDYYHLDQSDLVISPSPQTVLSGLAPGTVLRGPNVGGAGRNLLIEALYVNAGSRVVSGLDMNASYRLEIDSARTLTFDFSGNHTFGFAVDTRDGQGLVEQVGTYSSTFGSLPAWRYNFGVTYEQGPVKLNVKLRHIDGIVDPALFGLPAANVSDVNYIDLAARVNLGSDGLGLLPGGELKFGITNLTDKNPPLIRNAVLFFGDGAPWDRGVYDIDGRMVYGSISVKF